MSHVPWLTIKASACTTNLTSSLPNHLCKVIHYLPMKTNNVISYAHCYNVSINGYSVTSMCQETREIGSLYRGQSIPYILGGRDGRYRSLFIPRTSLYRGSLNHHPRRFSRTIQYFKGLLPLKAPSKRPYSVYIYVLFFI